MDPNSRGPEEYGHERDGHAPRPRPSRDPLTPDLGPHAPALARTVQLVSGDFLLTVNPVDGSEIEVCPPGERPAPPEKLTPAERAEVERAARPPVPPGQATRPTPPLLARQDERERLVRLLARGRTVRLTGPGGSGRTRLLDTVAEDCADLAPDGVVRLSGFHRTADDLLHDLFHAVHRAPLHRPDRDELLARVREIGAVVVLDDAELGGAALDELLAATPECAFLIAATPDVPAPSADAAVEEVFLTGLDRSDGVDLLEHAAGRSLTEEEANWAGDLWFESEGLPLRFVQAGALLRQRDRLRAGAAAVDEHGVFADAVPEDARPGDGGTGADVPLPSLGEAAAPAPLLASRLSASARATLEFAVALGGEIPHQAHLPALVGDTHADAALGELAACGLVSPVGSRYRLAAGVLTQLEAAGYGDDVRGRALAAARHYAWWAGHPSVTPERVCAEADAVLTALAVLAPATAPPPEGEESPAVQLARTAAPAFAAGLHWSAWERALRSGAEAARLAGDVTEQAYFHHELGVLALCEGELDRARAELETSVGLRGAAADKRGTVAGRRALALVADRSGDTPGLGAVGLGATPAGGALGGTGPTVAEEIPDVRHEESASPHAGVPAPFPPLRPASQSPALVTHRGPAGGPARKARGGIKGFARRNLVAAGAGAMLVAVLGTVVTLGATSDNEPGSPSDRVGVNPSASQGADDGGLGADRAPDDGEGSGGGATGPAGPGPDGTPGTSDDPAPTESGKPSDGPSGTGTPTEPDDPSDSQKPPTSGGPTTKPTSPKPTDSSKPPTGTEKPPTETEDPPTQSPDPTPTETETTSPSTSDSASATSSGPAESSSSASAPVTARRRAAPARRAPRTATSSSEPMRRVRREGRVLGGPGPPVVPRLSEQPQLVVLDAPQGVVVEHLAGDAAVRGEDPGLRLDLLGREDAAHRGEMRVPVQQFQIAGELLHAVDLAAPLDLDGDRPPLRVAAQDVDRADRGRVLAADQGVALAERLDPVGEQFLEVRFHAVLDQAGVHAQFVRGVVEDLLHRDDELLARLVDDRPHAGLVAGALLQRAGRRHPVQGLVGPVVGVDRDAAVRLDQDQAGRRGEVGGEPAGVVHGAAGNDETHGRQRYSTRPPGRDSHPSRPRWDVPLLPYAPG